MIFILKNHDMKIKITEAQMKRLIEINLPNNEDPIGVLQRNILRLEPIMTKIFNELTNLSIVDIADTNFDNINNVISEMESKTRVLERNANDYIESQPEEDNWDLESRLTDASYEFGKKLTVLEDLAYKLNQLQEYIIENDIMSKFPATDITDIQ
jgi:hypothetical protein